MYDERIVTPMRQELTRLGIEETRTADAVDVGRRARFLDAEPRELLAHRSD